MPKKTDRVADLRPAGYNPRTITDAEQAGLSAAMREFGDLSGVVVNIKTGNMVAGHQRVKQIDKSCKIEKRPHKDEVGTVALGYIETPYGRWNYREVLWELDREMAANIAANKHGGHFDNAKLKPVLVHLSKTAINLDLTGFNPKDIQNIIKGKQVKDRPDEDMVPEVATAKGIKAGDVWTLGEHRLMCGDSTKEEEVRRLMNGQLADMVFTDPPYGVSYVAKSGKFRMIKNDNKTSDELIKSLLFPAFKNLVKYTKDHAAFYIWHASTTRREYDDAMRAAGLIERQYLIWAKPSIVLGHADYCWMHEPCFYAGKDGQAIKFYGDRAEPTVWRVTRKAGTDQTTVLGPGLQITDGNNNRIYIVGKTAKGKKWRSVRLQPEQLLKIHADGDTGDLWEVSRDSGAEHPTQKPVDLSRRAMENSTKPGQLVVDLFGGSGSTLIGGEKTGRRVYTMEMDKKYVDVIIRRWEAYTGQKAIKVSNGKHSRKDKEDTAGRQAE